MKGKFILFEGIDGSGKSTQTDLFYRYLLEKEIKAIKIAEPTSGRWGKIIREKLKGDDSFDPQEQLDLFIKDRIEDVNNNILPGLNESRVVVLDRYYYSNAAYQGAGGLDPHEIIEANRIEGFPEPDRIYFIDISPEVAMNRIKLRGSSDDMFEKESFLRRVREIYLSIKNDQFLIIDGEQNIDKIFETIKNDFELNINLPADSILKKDLI